MTKREYEQKRDLTIQGDIWEGKYYTNFPDSLKKLFPMYGPKDVNTNMENILEINNPVIGYMLRRSDWSAVPMAGWEKVGTGKYLGPDSGDIEMYEKFFDTGKYIINNNSSFYLFTGGNTRYILILHLI